MEQLEDMQELNLGILAALSTYETDRTVPTESTLNVKPKVSISASKSPQTAVEIELLAWLRGLQLSHIFDQLSAAGFTSVEELVAKSEELTVEHMQSIGIVAPGEFLTLLAALELEAKYTHTRPWCPFSCYSDYVCTQTLVSVAPLYDWMRSLDLEADFDNFYYAGFKTLEPLLALMHTKFALTDYSLQCLIHIEKLGHRHRILSRLLEDAASIDPYTVLLGATGLRATNRTEGRCVLM